MSIILFSGMKQGWKQLAAACGTPLGGYLPGKTGFLVSQTQEIHYRRKGPEDQDRGSKETEMTQPSANEEPQGELLLRTMPLPADTSFNGDIFGGWIMSQMDIAGSILAKEVTRTRTATVAVESMKFIKPVKVGDVVCCYGRVVRIGNTSVTIMLEVWVKPILRTTEDRFTLFKVTEAAFTYVSISEAGVKQPINRERFSS